MEYYYQESVATYLKADRAVTLHEECTIQPREGSVLKPSTICDVFVLNSKEQQAYLCEVTYDKSLGSLSKRLTDWNSQWPLVQEALVDDCGLDRKWAVRPWLFIPEYLVPRAVGIVHRLQKLGTMPLARITTLEMVAPWKYADPRIGEEPKPTTIPVEMR